MKLIKTQAYQTSDGRLWTDHEQAVSVEIELLIDPKASGSVSTFTKNLVKKRRDVISLLRSLDEVPMED